MSQAAASRSESAATHFADHGFLSNVWGRVLFIAAGYVVLGFAGRQLALPPGFASPIWLAAGLALGVLLVWGWRYWPAVALGSFTFQLSVNYDLLGPGGLIASALIALGAALQALVGARLARPLIENEMPLARGWDAARLLFLSGPLACVISASVGIASLRGFGQIPSEGFAYQWLTWWVGDTIGVLLLAPLVFIVLRRNVMATPRRIASIALPLAITGALVVLLNLGIDRAEEMDASHRAEEKAIQVFRAADRRLPAMLEKVESVARLFSMRTQVSREEFQAFASPLVESPTTLAIEWAPRVPVEQHEDGSSLGADRFPVRFFAQGQSNIAKPGFDHAADPGRRAVMDGARDSGKPTATEAHVLPRTGQAGIAVYLPVYRPGFDREQANVASRQAALRGFVIVVFDVQAFVSSLSQRAEQNGLLFRLSNITDADAPKGTTGTLAAGQASRWSHDLELGGQFWRLEFAPAPGYWQPKRSGASLLLVATSLFAVYLVCLSVLGVAARAAALAVEVRARREAETGLRDFNTRLEAEAVKRAAELIETEQQLRTTFHLASIGIAQIDKTGRFRRVNRFLCDLTGYSESELLQKRFSDITHPDDLAESEAQVEPLWQGETASFSIRKRYLRKDGNTVWVNVTGSVVRDADGKVQHGITIIEEITARRSAEALISGQNRVLEMVAAEAPLNSSLDALARLAESQTPDMLCSILLLDADGKHLRHAAAPSLPEPYNRAIDGIAIGEGVGSCGTAAFRGKPVIVEDILTDPLWADFRELATEHDLRACWSHPIFNARGQMLGTFALYFRELTKPAKHHRRLIAMAVRTAAIAIERTREQQALSDSENLFRSTFELAPIGIGINAPDGRSLRANQKVSELTGYSKSELMQMTHRDITHPDDIALDTEKVSQLMNGEIDNYTLEKRYVRKDGTTIWARVRSSLLRNPDGTPKYRIAIIEDINWRRKAEAELNHQQAMMNLLLENLGEGVVACDADGKLFLFNKTAREWHGLDPRDIPAEKWSQYYDLFGADGVTALETSEIPLMRAFKGERVRDVEMSIVKKGEAQRFVLASGGPLCDAQGVQQGAVVVMRDITDRRRNNRRFANLFEYAPDATIMTNAAGNITQFNRQAEQLFGWEREEILGRPIETLIPAGKRDGHVDMRRSFLQTSKPRAMGAGRNNLRGLRRDGTTFPVDISLSPIESEDGPMVAASVRDVSERLRADQTVRESLATLDATVDGVFIFEPETLRFSYVNDGAIKQVGYSREELLQMTPLDIKPRYQEDAFRELLRQARESENRTHHFTTDHRHRDGHDVPVEINLQYVAPEGGQPRFIAVVRDYSERQRALREMKFFSDLDGATRTLDDPEQIMAVTTQLLGKHLNVSRCAYAEVAADGEKFRIVRDYTDGCPTTVGDYLLSNFGPRAAAEMSGGRSLIVRDVDAELAGAGGDTFRAIGIQAIVCFPLIKNDKLRAMMAVHQITPRDWTPEEIALLQTVTERCWATIERERAQRELRHTAEKLKAANAAVARESTLLAERVAERTTELMSANRELARAKDSAESASRAKSSFLATVSHEIRTPLHGVLGAIELLEAGEFDEDQHRLLSTARGSARSLLGLLNDLLDMAKIEAGRIEIVNEPLEIDRIVEQVVSTHQPSAIMKGIKLVSSTNASVPQWMNADAMRLRQILGNLVSNAIKFTERGGVTIGVDSIAHEGRAHRLQFVVRDSGAGIPAKVLANLFRPFEQGGADVAKRSGGTGLGLAICRGLASQMGGTVQLESVPGEGTTATLEVVLETASDADRIAAGSSPVESQDFGPRARQELATSIGSGNSRKVLVVDDHPVNRMLLVRQLAELGLVTEAVSDGEEALEKLRNDDFALLITDCEMPRLDGYALARAIRSGKATDRSMPIIACTAHALPEVAQRCKNAGINEVLTKPVELAVLAQMLTNWWPDKTIAAPHNEALAAPADEQSAIFDRSVLARVSGGVRETEREVIEDFRSAHAQILAELGEAIAATGHERCVHLAHLGKGACKTVGAGAMADAFARVESAARKGAGPESLHELWSEIQAEASRLEPALLEFSEGEVA